MVCRKNYLKKLSYRRLIALMVLMLLCVIIVAYTGYRHSESQYNKYQTGRKEAAVRANQLLNLFGDKMDELLDYYLAVMEGESTRWLIENEIGYENFSKYTESYEMMDRKVLDISSFALINRKTGWILSKKGLYTIEKVINIEQIRKILAEAKESNMPKNYWLYCKEDNAADQTKKEWRYCVDIQGMNLVVGIPVNSYSEFGELLVNIAPQKYNKWIQSWLNEGENVIVLSEEKDVVYCSDSRFLEETQEMFDTGEQIKDGKEKSYVIASAQSVNCLNWRFYVIYDLNRGLKQENSLLGIWFLLVCVLLLIVFILMGLMLYYPVNTVTREIADKNGEDKVPGNEIYYLSEKFSRLNQDKDVLEQVVQQQKVHLEELFSQRLLRGEISSPEWKDYIKELGKEPGKSYVVILLVPGEQEDKEPSRLWEDALCLKTIQNMPEVLKQECLLQPVYHAGSIFCLLTAQSEELLQEKCSNFVKALQEYICKELKLSVKVGISAVHTDYNHVHNAYREGINALLTQNISQKSIGKDSVNEEAEGEIFYYVSDMVQEKGRLGEKYDYSFEKNIQRSLRSMDKQESLDITQKFFLYLSENCGSIEEIRLCVLSYVNGVLMTAFRMMTDIEKLNESGITGIYRELLERKTLEQMEKYVETGLIETIYEERMAHINKQSGSITERVYHLIAEHKGNITLYECAEELGMDSNYVWKALKLVDNKSFSEIAEDYKLEEAKSFLLQSDKKVNDIAIELGYSNTQNFIRFFSRCTGMTPGKYRRLNHM